MGDFKVNTIKTDNFEMNYIVFGTGNKNLVILPGMGLKSIILSAMPISSAYSDFSKEYTVYVFDRKKNMRMGYSIEDMATDTATAMKIIGIEKANIFGASMGGMIAQYIAIKYPEIPEKLVIASSIARKGKIIENTMNMWKKLALKKSVHELVTDIFSRLYNADFPLENADIVSVLEKAVTEEDCYNYAVMAQACLDFDIYSEIQKIKCPTLVIGAGLDNALGVEGSYEIAEKIGCEIYIYENYGHTVYDEAQDYKNRLKEFFNK